MARKIEVEIVGDSRSLERALGRSQTATSKWRQGLGRAAKFSGLAFAAIGAGAIKATRDASHLNEMINATNVVFGKSAKNVLAWSKDTTDAFSQVDFLGAAKSFAVFARQAGFGDRATAEFSKSLLSAAQDMASFHDADPTEVLMNIRSGLAGEAEPLRKYGILMSEAAVQQEAVRMGLVDAIGPLNERQKVMARQSLILGQLGAAEGDWVRTRDQAANRERTAIANAKDLSAQLGTALLPAFQQIVSIGLRVVAFLGKHSTATKVGVAVVAAFTASVWLLNAALAVAAANPIVLATAGIVALGVALVVAYKKSETFRNIVNAVFKTVAAVAGAAIEFIRSHWLLLLALLTGGLGPAVVKIVQNWRAIRDAGVAAWDAVAGAVRSVIGVVSTLIGWLQRAISALATVKSVAGDILSGGGGAPTYKFGGARQHGGPVATGSSYLVGERGPELFVPRSSGTVVASGGMAGGAVQVIVLGGDDSAIRWLQKIIGGYARQNGGRGLL